MTIFWVNTVFFSTKTLNLPDVHPWLSIVLVKILNFMINPRWELRYNILYIFNRRIPFVSDKEIVGFPKQTLK